MPSDRKEKTLEAPSDSEEKTPEAPSDSEEEMNDEAGPVAGSTAFRRAGRTYTLDAHHERQSSAK